MKKEFVLKRYLEVRKQSLIESVCVVILSVLVLTATVILYLRFPSAMDMYDWLVVFVLAICFAWVFGYLISAKHLIKSYKTIQKIKAEEYQIVEDIVIEKHVVKGPFFSMLYILGFEKYAPEGRTGPHKNGYLVDRKGYQKVNIGDKKHFLVLNGNKGWYTCSIKPSESK